ncbi:MAG: serine protease [Bryobacterales bacterium]|nr:serine protease [Bryobacterales bacterium]
MEMDLVTVSENLAKVVESAGRYVVSVQTHPRVPASGVYWQNGVVVTAEHVLKGFTEAEITAPDGSKHKGTLAGKDESTGLAAFRFDGIELPVPTLSNAEAWKPGNLTLTVGRSKRGATASMGVISSIGGPWRTWRGGDVDRFVQLDYSLYPSSSGGAVVDAKGDLIGIATQAFSRFGAVAIPASTVNRVLPSLLAAGYVARGYLGVGLRAVPLPESMHALMIEPGPTGVIVLSVEDGTPAHQAGICIGDIFVGFDNQPVRDSDDVQGMLGPGSVGRAIHVSLIRGGKRVELEVQIGERKREAE